MTKVRQFLPAVQLIGRERDLVDFFSDRGRRVVAVEDIRTYKRGSRQRKVTVAVAAEDEEE